MYDLGFPNNNCVGCIKGGMGYWNKIREEFPEVFAARAALERKVGGSCINGTYLDELDPEAGRDCEIIVPECGAMCEAMSFSNAHHQGTAVASTVQGDVGIQNQEEINGQALQRDD